MSTTPSESALAAARSYLATRSIAQAFLPDADLVLTPAWDMLTVLFSAGEGADGLSEAELYEGIAAPRRLAERWLAVLAQRGLAVALEGHRVAISPAASAMLDDYFEKVAGLSAA